MFEYFSRTDIIVFFVSFCIGIIFVCLTESRPDIIIRWPTPENAGLIKYIDKANNCYVYETEEVPCDEHSKQIPIQKGILKPQDKTLKIFKQSWEESFL
jgi:hypothetical protein